MGQIGESINKVKFQPVPASTIRERNSEPADSGTKEHSVVKRFRSRFFSGLRISATKGFTFVPVSKTFFYEAISPECRATEWRGMC